MKKLLIFSIALFCASAGRSQNSQSDFRAAVQQELARYPHGAKLYRQCDVFSRKVNAVAAKKLALASGKKVQDIPLDAEQDTSNVSDISRTSNDENEPSIAINRRNPKIVVAGANDGAMTRLSMPSYLSTDAGMTWKTYRLPRVDDLGAGSYGDPIIISDDAGIFYYAFLVDDTNSFGISDLMVAHSTDGEHWTLGSPVMGNTGNDTVLEDKETIAVDQDAHSPYYGRLYIAWSEYHFFNSFGVDSIYHFFAYSDTKGNTWSTPIPYTWDLGFFALLRVGANGTIFIASMVEDGAGAGTHGMSISQDGGATFTEAPITYFADFPYDSSIGRNGLKGNNGFRATPYSCFDLDSNNTIFAVYGTYDTMNAAATLYEVTSSDLGQSWSNPVQIGTPAGLGNDHYMPWVTHDPVTHKTYVSLSSSEEDKVLNIKSRQMWCSYESPNQLEPLGTRLFNPLLVANYGYAFIGDYAGNDAYDSYYAACWTENRPPNHIDGDIFAYVSSPLASNAVRQINAHEFDVSNFAPNPVSGTLVSFTISSNEQGNAAVHLFDLQGRNVLTTQTAIGPDDANVVSLDIHMLSAGVYRAVISMGRATVERNLVILR